MKIFNLLNNFIKNLIRQCYKQIKKIINYNKYNLFKNINLYKLFNSTVIFILIYIFINLLLTIFLIKII